MRGKGPVTKRYTDKAFLKKLGEHCRQIRIHKGYSIDRMARESDRLSTSVIHRLETGSAPVSISSLVRYAEVLGLEPKDLLDFERDEQDQGDAFEMPVKTAANGAFVSTLPLYSIKAAAGYFGEARSVDPEKWIKIDRTKIKRLDPAMFVVRVIGKSMEPQIADGALVVFRANPTGTKQGKIVLAQYRGPADPESGGSFTVKQYFSEKAASPDGQTWQHKTVRLVPINKSYEPIVLTPKHKDDVRIIGEFVALV